ncbi:MAG: response regulator transcription factor [Sphingobacteriaceae bacterium]|nr:response regulator transcription factor [Sphingobacteriaceae bacterium]MBK7816348.1 response regulator transcription factor [Sphingobacteriaceae bacterium]
MVSNVKVIIAEDQTILRKALVVYLQRSGSIEVAGDVSNGKQLLTLVKKQSPDLTILDLNIPVIDGFEAIDIIKTKFPKVKILVMSNVDDPLTLSKLISKGVNGFVSKGAELAELTDSIHKVINNELVFENKLIAQHKEGKLLSEKIDELFSDKETRVMKEICNGLTNIQISKRLSISAATVNYHKQRIYRKTQSKHAVDLLRFVHKHQLLSFD